MHRPHCFAVILFCIPLYSATVCAQLPFYTDDADTTPKRQFHLEMYNEHDVLQASAYPVKRQNTLVFTLNYGLTNNLELGVNAPYITLINSRVVDSGAVSGQGDVQFGFKYKLRNEREGSKLPAFAIVFYAEAPTGSVRKELGSGLTDYWLYGIAQKSLTKRTTARVNGGILFSGNSSTGLIGIRTERGQVYTGNLSLVRAFSARLSLGAEVFGAVTNNFKLDRGQLTAQLGAQYALTKKVTLTFGLLGGSFTASPRAGVHLGFSYN
jgi:hypothetical protein